MTRSRVAVILSLAALGQLGLACAIPDIELDGLPCPCANGFECDPATSTCVREVGVDGGSHADGGPDARGGLDSGPGTDGGTQELDGGTVGADASSCFYDDFEDGVLDGWQIEAGDWSAVGGEARQGDFRASLAYMFAEETTRLTNYRIRSQFRLVRDDGPGAIEVDFRIDPAQTGSQYFCNWEPNTGDFLVMWQSPSITTEVIDMLTIDTDTISGFDVNAPITMNIEVRGSTIHCWLDEIPGADLTVTDARHPTGAVGFKTYALSAAYQFLEVCPL